MNSHCLAAPPGTAAAKANTSDIPLGVWAPCSTTRYIRLCVSARAMFPDAPAGVEQVAGPVVLLQGCLKLQRAHGVCGCCRLHVINAMYHEGLLEHMRSLLFCRLVWAG